MHVWMWQLIDFTLCITLWRLANGGRNDNDAIVSLERGRAVVNLRELFTTFLLIEHSWNSYTYNSMLCGVHRCSIALTHSCWQYIWKKTTYSRPIVS